MDRLEAEFFHLQPDLQVNGNAVSLALSSVLNEAVNLQEAAFQSPFFKTIKAWQLQQTWSWNDVVIRFTWWPVCTQLEPFALSPDGDLTIAGRGANNAVKHTGALATLRDTISAVAAAWFLVLERAREACIFLDPNDGRQLTRIFDCFELVDIHDTEFGQSVDRPLMNRVEYPAIRGKSEIDAAKEAFARRLDRSRS